MVPASASIPKEYPHRALHAPQAQEFKISKCIPFTQSLDTFQQLLLCWTLRLVSLSLNPLSGVSQFATDFWISWV